MAATIAGYTVSRYREAHTVSVSNANRRRLISAQAGRALEIHGHAIEYLSDEYVNEAQQFSEHDPQVEAIQILMAFNREMYFGCPVMPTLQGAIARIVPVPCALTLHLAGQCLDLKFLPTLALGAPNGSLNLCISPFEKP